ncbi:MAG: phenylacetate--CoA ligase [Methanocellales archaeon]
MKIIAPMKYWERELETLKRGELKKLQLRRLKAAVQRVYRNVPFYRSKFASKPEISKLEDVQKLPFTSKSDIRDSYPFKMFAVPMSQVIRLHASSGTSGKPTVVGYTQRDIETWANLIARCLTMVGVRKGDIFQNAVGYGLFTGGLGFHYGAEKIGVTIVPAGTGTTMRQIEMLLDFGVTVIHCTPSYALYIAETAEENGIDASQFSLRIGCFGAEPWSENTRKELEEALDIKAYDSYGLSEMFGPGVAFECEEQNGLHIWEDHFLVEVVDSKGEQCSPGESGELVLTSLTKEALPLIRYRTGDIAKILEDPCPCGRTSIRISRILGRADDMMVIRGINVFPSQIEHVLMGIPEVGEYFQVVVDRRKYLDEITVKVELNEKSFTGELDDLKRIQNKIANQLYNALNLRTNVILVERGTLPRVEGKYKRIIDLREKI